MLQNLLQEMLQKMLQKYCKIFEIVANVAETLEML